jgi:hypothetical protein
MNSDGRPAANPWRARDQGSGRGRRTRGGPEIRAAGAGGKGGLRGGQTLGGENAHWEEFRAGRLAWAGEAVTGKRAAMP